MLIILLSRIVGSLLQLYDDESLHLQALRGTVLWDSWCWMPETMLVVAHQNHPKPMIVLVLYQIHYILLYSDLNWNYHENSIWMWPRLDRVLNAVCSFLSVRSKASFKTLVHLVLPFHAFWVGRAVWSWYNDGGVRSVVPSRSGIF